MCQMDTNHTRIDPVRRSMKTYLRLIVSPARSSRGRTRRIHSAHLEPALTRIAHHYHVAAALGYTDKAVAYALRAAEKCRSDLRI